MASKRANVFGQARKEDPYNSRWEEPVDEPKQATAAQMAARKVKAPKGRRQLGISSGLSAPPSPSPFSVNFPSADGFNSSDTTTNNTNRNTANEGHFNFFYPRAGGNDTNSDNTNANATAPAFSFLQQSQPTTSNSDNTNANATAPAFSFLQQSQPTTSNSDNTNANATAPAFSFSSFPPAQQATFTNANATTGAFSFLQQSQPTISSFPPAQQATFTNANATAPAFSFLQQSQPTTSSFPPAQQATPTNLFTNSSFPSFGNPFSMLPVATPLSEPIPSEPASLPEATQPSVSVPLEPATLSEAAQPSLSMASSPEPATLPEATQPSISVPLEPATVSEAAQPPVLVASPPESAAPQSEPAASTEQANPPTTAQPAKIPKIPRAQVPPNWSADKTDTSDDLSGLAVQLASLNEHFLAKLKNTEVMADWSLLCAWHQKQTSEIMKKIATVKKQRAAAKGITGTESSLSTKRKITEESSPQEQTATPSKKAKGIATPTTPTPATSVVQPSTTPKLSPPASQTSNLFGNLLSKTGDATTAPNPFSPSKPISGASTPGLFTSGAVSPAQFGGTNSVLETPSNTGTSSPNIFGHLSSGPSSNNQDDDDDDEEDEEDHSDSHSQTDQPTDSGTADKHKLGDTDSESESLEETMRRKKQDMATSKPSLASRMTKADDSEVEQTDSEKENDKPNNSTSIFGQSNGLQTPGKRFHFDFAGAAAGMSAPPKANAFGGDHTFKAGTPIKFGTEKKDPPLFQFQPATPSAAEFSATPSKPAPFTFGQSAGTSSTPSWLSPYVGASAAGSIASSVLSSRAPTPLSEAETSGKDSAAENEDSEGGPGDQLDLSNLSAEEKAENEILFHAPQALAKRQADKGGAKVWENFARGQLWILKNKETGKAFLRIRVKSGNTPLNYNLLPKLKTTVTGNSKKMVNAAYPGKDGKLTHVFFALKDMEVATEFSEVYNNNLPSA